MKQERKDKYVGYFEVDGIRFPITSYTKLKEISPGVREPTVTVDRDEDGNFRQVKPKPERN